jgi:hypothetical protein
MEIQMAKVTIDGIAYKVIERLGYMHDVGNYVTEVETETGPRMAVGSPRRGYRFWTAVDRTAPLHEAVARGWPANRPA